MLAVLANLASFDVSLDRPTDTSKVFVNVLENKCVQRYVKTKYF